MKDLFLGYRNPFIFSIKIPQAGDYLKSKPKI